MSTPGADDRTPERWVREGGDNLRTEDHGSPYPGIAGCLAAIAAYDRALRLAPDHPGARSGKAYALATLGYRLHQEDRHAEAAASYADAQGVALDARSDPGFNCLHFGLWCDALSHLGLHAEVLAACDRVLAGPRDAVILPEYDARSYRAFALFNLGRYDEAVAAAERAAVDWPRRAQLPMLQGVALHTLGRLAEALAAFDRALALEPGDAELLRYRAETADALRGAAGPDASC